MVRGCQGSRTDGVTRSEPAARPNATRELSETTSYAKVMDNDEVKRKVNSIAGSVEQEYASTIRQLRDRNAVGVVVAVNGEIGVGRHFREHGPTGKYWPKLVRSYATDGGGDLRQGRAGEARMLRKRSSYLHGRHETVDSEPGLYRHTEVSGDGFKAFELTSLLPKTGFALHVAKMVE